MQRDQQMSESQTPRLGHLASAYKVCTCCGGSGVLRVDSSAYRTCLECLGQGQKPRFEMVFGLPDPLPPPAMEPCQRLSKVFRGDVSAWTSGAR
jgi:hypothetical protein